MSAVGVPDVLRSIARLRREDIEGMLRVAAISPGATGSNSGDDPVTPEAAGTQGAAGRAEGAL